MDKITVWMQPPDGGPAEEIECDAQGINVSQKLVLHWKVVDPLTAKATKRPAHPGSKTESEPRP